MKAVRNVLRVLAGLLAVGTVVLFFFNFAEVTFSETTNVLKLTGAELAFGADVTSQFADAGKELVTFKSGWYFLAFFAAAFTAVSAASPAVSRAFSSSSFTFSSMIRLLSCKDQNHWYPVKSPPQRKTRSKICAMIIPCSRGFRNLFPMSPASGR